jgi:hypothetical protein
MFGARTVWSDRIIKVVGFTNFETSTTLMSVERTFAGVNHEHDHSCIYEMNNNTLSSLLLQHHSECRISVVPKAFELIILSSLFVSVDLFAMQNIHEDTASDY